MGDRIRSEAVDEVHEKEQPDESAEEEEGDDERPVSLTL